MPPSLLRPLPDAEGHRQGDADDCARLHEGDRAVEVSRGPGQFSLAVGRTDRICFTSYVHLLCAVWHRELQLGAPAIVSPVEAFTLLPPQRQQAVCTLCKQKDVGTTVKCEDCSKHVHVACAWNSGWKFAFEVQSVRNKKRPPKDAVLVKFKETEGTSPSINRLVSGAC